MDVVLDLDLDFFVWPPTHQNPNGGRPSSRDCVVTRPEAVEAFLEKRCRLSKERRVTGRRILSHDEAFDVWREWMDDGILRAPFQVLHVDAHSDLGAGFGTGDLTYLMTEFLLLSPSSRTEPRRGRDAMHEGNYLLFALAARWIASLEYVFPPLLHPKQSRRSVSGSTASRSRIIHTFVDPDGTVTNRELQAPIADRSAKRSRFSSSSKGGNDVPSFVLGPSHHHVQLKSYRRPGDWGIGATPMSVEPAVPFRRTQAAVFASPVAPTHVIFAQSPAWTPPTADALVPIISQYIQGDPTN